LVGGVAAPENPRRAAVDARDVTSPAPEPPELDYEPPELVELGSFEEMTQGGTGDRSDGADLVTTF
jgi:hypothetical protein